MVYAFDGQMCIFLCSCKKIFFKLQTRPTDYCLTMSFLEPTLSDLYPCVPMNRALNIDFWHRIANSRSEVVTMPDRTDRVRLTGGILVDGGVQTYENFSKPIVRRRID